MHESMILLNNGAAILNKDDATLLPTARDGMNTAPERLFQECGIAKTAAMPGRSSDDLHSGGFVGP